MPNLTLLRARNLLKKGYKGFPSRINIHTGVPKKKDESIAPLFIGGFQLSVHHIKWLLIGYKTAY
jgi:hypothetical protein